MANNEILLSEILPTGVKYSKIIKRGQRIRLYANGDNASLSAMFYNSDNFSERFNSADTVKVQWNAFLGTGKVLLSEMGRVLFAITGDTTDGLFDVMGGISNPRIIKENFEEHTYDGCRNGYYKSDRENFLIELGKYGLGKKDMIQGLNLFRKVEIEDGNKMVLLDRKAKEGDFIELHACMNVLLVLSNTPHVMDKSRVYNPSDIKIEIIKGDALDEQSFSEEAQRGFINTNRYFV
jgi:hypothetical protein